MRNCMDQLRDLFKANIQCIWVNTYEENDFIEDLRQLLYEEFPTMKLQSWSASSGLQMIPLDDAEEMQPVDKSFVDAHRVMGRIAELQKAGDGNSNVFVMRDFHSQLDGAVTFKRAVRDAKEIKRALNYNPIVIVSPVVSIPQELEKLFTVIDYDIPDRAFLTNFISRTLQGLRMKASSNSDIIVPAQEDVPHIVDALIGLTLREVKECVSKSLVKAKTIDPALIIQQKIQLIKKSGVLSYEIPNVRLDEVGGNENFKEWVDEVKLSMTEEAKAFGCKRSKGYLALGVPGCAKTLLSKALATELRVPLLKLDMSKIMDKLVGQSEKKIEQAFRVAQACAPCVMLWDEVEKALGGIKSSNASDSGSTARVFASCLNFLNDNEDVFVIMTSNDVSQLPPEFTRSGRLDAIWYFTLPTELERQNIFKIHLDKTGKAYDEDLIEIAAQESENYTGAEIESVVKASLWKAFKRYREDGNDAITSDDVLSAIDEVVPIYISSKEKINALELWAKGRARYASIDEDVEVAKDTAKKAFSNVVSVKIDD